MVSKRIAFSGPYVRLLEPARAPTTAVERIAADLLREKGRIPLERLVEEACRRLYDDALRRGARALDIGLYGPELFAGEIISALWSANGILWAIERSEGDGNGLLSDFRENG